MRKIPDKAIRCGRHRYSAVASAETAAIGLNEPADITYGTHVVTLTADTIRQIPASSRARTGAASGSFDGHQQHLAAKCVVLVATGENKAKAVHDTIRRPVTRACPRQSCSCIPAA